MMEALQNGAAADAAADAGTEQVTTHVQEVTPAGETQHQIEPTQVQPAQPVAPAQQNTETFDGGKFNPDQLPDELKPAWSQLQAAFTQKTQQLAEERKQYEALGDTQSLQQAVELMTRISDPSSWPQLHKELTEAAAEYGIELTPTEAARVAAAVEQTPAAPELPSPDEIDDPELSAVVRRLQETETRLSELQNGVQSEREAAQAEYERQAFLGELQRQENAIRAAHPTWDDERIETVYALSSFYGGDLAQAANHLETQLARERELYLAEKAGVQEQTGRLVPPATASTQSHQVHEPSTLEEAEAGATEMFARLLEHYSQ